MSSGWFSLERSGHGGTFQNIPIGQPVPSNIHTFSHGGAHTDTKTRACVDHTCAAHTHTHTGTDIHALTERERLHVL